MKKWWLIACLVLLIVAGCSNGSKEPEQETPSGNQKPDVAENGQTPAVENKQEALSPVTLKLMIPGDRPADFDKVIAEAERRMQGNLNIKLDVVFIAFSDIGQKTQVTLASGEEIDLVFDAPWLHLNQMIASDYYEPLDALIAEYGPNLISARSEQMIDANKYNGQIYALPLGNSYFQGRVYYVRKDIREALGIAPIETHEQLISFAYAVKEAYPEMIPLLPDDGPMSWAQYQKVFDTTDWIKDTQIGTNGVLYHKNNDGRVYNMFEDRDERYWSWYEEANRLYQDGIIYADVLSIKDSKQELKSGKAAIINTNDFGVLTDVQNAVQAAGGEIEMVTFFEEVPGANLTDFKVWNFLALAKVSKNKERAIQFLNWTQEKENYDLLAYGIEGENWEAIGDSQYRKLNDGYPWFPYAWIWNPQHDRFDENLGEEAIRMSQFTGVADNFTADVLTGFTFDTTSVANEIAQLNTVMGKYLDPLSNGVMDLADNWEKYKSEASAVVKRIQEEYQSQVDQFLSEQ